MEQTILALEKLLPEAIGTFKVRYTLLQAIDENGPIGRRLLASLTGLSERTARAEVEFLQRQGMIEVAHAGMTLLPPGRELLCDLYMLFQELEGFKDLEAEVKQILRLKEAVIVKGNVDEQPAVKHKIGQAGAKLLASLIKDGNMIALTGGTTISNMVDNFLTPDTTYSGVTVIPARGSLGGKVEFQASTLVAQLAKKLGGKYELLSIPDNLSQSTVESIKKEPYIQKLLQKLAKSDIIIFGLGDANRMAKRRKEPESVIELLKDKQAVAEAFRYYFDNTGQVIYAHPTVGVDLDTAMKVPYRIAVAGGQSKAKAILATSRLLDGSYLVLDEGAAREIIRLHQNTLHEVSSH